jgi:hypothetical protein
MAGECRAQKFFQEILSKPVCGLGGVVTWAFSGSGVHSTHCGIDIEVEYKILK